MKQDLKTISTSDLLKGLVPGALSTQFDANWKELVARLEPQANSLISMLPRIAASEKTLLAELAGSARMLMLAKSSWDMTEVEPGDCAGITYEKPSADERVAARVRVYEAMKFSESIMIKIQATLAATA